MRYMRRYETFDSDREYLQRKVTLAHDKTARDPAGGNFKGSGLAMAKVGTDQGPAAVCRDVRRETKCITVAHSDGL
ncbi:hypothetical protein QIS74_08743 [Colletotrichum tabaci]|uniref:Uncharacterized protein n=1 Tax=Colletotrichum tabaci TaxID=1209068 RepID=A0AAV9T986_9PEZI